jgi:hypothetical protein
LLSRIQYYVESLELDLLEKENYIFLYVDDISYSGSQFSSVLNNIYYTIVVKNKKPPPKVYVCLLGANSESYETLTKVPIKTTSSGRFLDFGKTPFKIICGELMPTIYEEVGFKRAVYMILFFYPFILQYLQPFVSIYLDIKLADSLSTFKFAIQYGPIVPSNFLSQNNELFESLFDYINYVPSESFIKTIKKDMKDIKDEDVHIYVQKYINGLVDYLKENENLDKEILEPIYYPLIENCEENTYAKLEKHKNIFYKNYFLVTMKDNWREFVSEMWDI